MKGDGFGGNVDADVAFCAGLVRAPGDELCAGLFVDLVFLMRGPIRGQEDLQAGDEFCQALKKAFEARTTNFAGAPPAKLPGAKDCLVKKVSATADAGSKFICYWQEASASAGETRFRDLVARLQILLPSDWSSHQENELDEQTGAPLIAWRADGPGAKYDVRVYVSAEAVALHITARR